MKNKVDGNNQKPVLRNQNNSAISRSTSAGSRPKRPQPNINRQQAQRQPVQSKPQRPVNPANRTPDRKPVTNQAQRPVQKAGQRPVPQKQGRPEVRNQVQKPANRPAPNNAKRPVQTASKKPVQKAVPDKTSSKPKRSSKKFNFVPLVLILAAVLLIVIGYFSIKSFLEKEYAMVNTEMTIEAGSVKPDLGMFVKGEPTFENFLSCNLNFDEVNINLPQTIRFTVTMYGKNFPCVLTIVDTIAPTAEGVPQQIFASQEMPDPMTCITNVQDVTDCTASWYEVPDMSRGGRYNTYVTLTDAVGNQTYVVVPFEVTVDANPPEIKGYQDLEVYLGAIVSYRMYLIISDDHDSNPALDIRPLDRVKILPGEKQRTLAFGDIVFK